MPTAHVHTPAGRAVASARSDHASTHKCPPCPNSAQTRPPKHPCGLSGVDVDMGLGTQSKVTCNEQFP